jgi:hypothetical protein
MKQGLCHTRQWWLSDQRYAGVARFCSLRLPEWYVARKRVDSFPVLTLEQVYGAITYYLAHQAEIDTYRPKSSA